MSELKEFDIDIIRLSNGNYEYDFELGHSFFAQFPNSILDRGALKAKVQLEKNERLLMCVFLIKGTVTLVCDRSLEEFEEELSFKEKLAFKYGEEWKELSDEIIQIPYDTQKLNVAQYIFEFIGLQIPIKKLHPRFRNEEDEMGETKLIYKSDLLEDEDKFNIDPRWEALKKIKKDLNDE
ncbi:MAG: DUF177 domain-containing protein [Cytophagaceae bacterium]|nr:DUF177 domain-containing protein [Cytophagaceae bacterium]